MDDIISQIIDEWFDTYASAGVNVQRRVTKKRKRLIQDILMDYHHEDIILVLKYLRLSKDDYARFMRGDNKSKRHYLNLESIFRQHKFLDKIERAKEWQAQQADPIESEDVYNPFKIMFGASNELD